MQPTISAIQHTHPGRKPEDDTGDDDGDGLELPVNPDEGTPLLPDDDGQVSVPT